MLFSLTPEIVNSRVVAGERDVSFADIVSRGDIRRPFSDEELAAMPVKAAADRRLGPTERRTPSRERGDQSNTKENRMITVKTAITTKPAMPKKRIIPIL